MGSRSPYCCELGDHCFWIAFLENNNKNNISSSEGRNKGPFEVKIMVRGTNLLHYYAENPFCQKKINFQFIVSSKNFNCQGNYLQLISTKRKKGEGRGERELKVRFHNMGRGRVKVEGKMRQLRSLSIATMPPYFLRR